MFLFLKNSEFLYIILSRLVILRIDTKNVSFLQLILDYQFKNLILRLSIIKILDMKSNMKISVLRMHHPTIVAEFEKSADAIIVLFGAQTQALFDIFSGKVEPSGFLPVQIPANMETVEHHCEYVQFDMEPYTDSIGNQYDFGYRLNWSGPIKDGRSDRYPKNFK